VLPLTNHILDTKNREHTESKQGAKTLLTVGAVVKKVMAATVLAVPKKINDCIYNCLTAQNKMIEQAFIGATKKNTHRRSHDGRSAKRARVAIDMGIDHWPTEGPVKGTKPTKKENR